MAWVYLNGDFVAPERALVAADDEGLLYGRGLFETFRARNGVVYRLDKHLERLAEGAALLGIPVPSPLKELAQAVGELAERCALPDTRVRLTLTAGPARGEPTVLMQARAVVEYPESLYERGMSAVVVSVRRNETSPLARTKSLSYLDNLLARAEARRAGADEALFLNTRGLLAEGSATNLFVVRQGELLTPPIEDGALPGVTRGSVMELALGAGIAVHEASLTLEDLRVADEAFLTNAVMGVMPLVAVDGAPLADGRLGPLSGRLRLLYEAVANAAPTYSMTGSERGHH